MGISSGVDNQQNDMGLSENGRWAPQMAIHSREIFGYSTLSQTQQNPKMLQSEKDTGMLDTLLYFGFSFR